MLGFQELWLIEGFLTVTVYFLGLMEELDVVDYSSDRLESSDIWEVPGGSFLEQLVDIPRPGQDFVGE